MLTVGSAVWQFDCSLTNSQNFFEGVADEAANAYKAAGDIQNGKHNASECKPNATSKHFMN